MSRMTKTLIVLAIIANIVSCASRYRLDTFMTFEEVTNKIKVKTTQLVMDAVIGDPMAEEKVRPGTGDVLVVTFQTRWQSLEDSDYPVLQFDENLTTMLYLELPSQRNDGTTFDLQGRSLFHILGRYDQPPEAKVFLPQSGTFVIDSIRSNRSFITLDGSFANADGAALQLDGSFKAKTEN